MVVSQCIVRTFAFSQNQFNCLSIYSAAGADAVAAVGDWWVLAMILYPDTQRRAQAEIDAFVGRSRIPTLADMDNLPYVRAMVSTVVFKIFTCSEISRQVKELLRWRPVVSLFFSRSSWNDP